MFRRITNLKNVTVIDSSIMQFIFLPVLFFPYCAVAFFYVTKNAFFYSVEFYFR